MHLLVNDIDKATVITRDDPYYKHLVESNAGNGDVGDLLSEYTTRRQFVIYNPEHEVFLSEPEGIFGWSKTIEAIFYNESNSYYWVNDVADKIFGEVIGFVNARSNLLWLINVEEFYYEHKMSQDLYDVRGVSTSSTVFNSTKEYYLILDYLNVIVFSGDDVNL
jgi:hypothetical protein